MLKSNKWDAAKDVLLASKRLECLEHLERKPRPYLKWNIEYWEPGIKEKRAALRDSLKSSPNDVQEQLQYDSVIGMTPSQIKDKLKEMGYPTQARNIQRLQELYQLALQEASQN